MAKNPRQIALDWLSRYDLSVTSRDVQATAGLFLPNGWLRDVLVFGWNNRALEGHAKIKDYLSNSLPTVKINNIALDERPGLEPQAFSLSPEQSGVELAFTFETHLAFGRGFARLLPDASQEGTWNALLAYMTAENIKGHEEMTHESGLYGGHTISWPEIRNVRRAEIEQDPHVLIVGAGQNGLQVAARFRQMGIRTIIIEKNARVGDNWRKRYPTLTLHTPRSHHSLLYTPFPANWPTYTPRDKLAFWLEQYAEAQNLVIWTSSEIVGSPTYNDATRRWTIDINKDNTKLTIHPAHVVLATGTLGAPLIPKILGMEKFKGEMLHAAQFAGGERYTGKRVVVVGAGNTSADICQDLVFRGAASVTMVQRSETCIITSAYSRGQVLAVWPDGVPSDISDFKANALPFGLFRRIAIATVGKEVEYHREMHDNLRKCGLKLNLGASGGGQLLNVFERLGGYWLDVGCADLIISGKVKIKSGLEIQHFTGNSVVFTDGSELEADVVVLATGYHNIRPSMKEIFGADVIDRTHEVWGLDDEGELRGCYRPSGQPGLWYAAGDFYCSRSMSKQMALLIKAEELGLMKYPGLGFDCETTHNGTKSSKS